MTALHRRVPLPGRRCGSSYQNHEQSRGLESGLQLQIAFAPLQVRLIFCSYAETLRKAPFSLALMERKQSQWGVLYRVTAPYVVTHGFVRGCVRYPSSTMALEHTFTDLATDPSQHCLIPYCHDIAPIHPNGPCCSSLLFWSDVR